MNRQNQRTAKTKGFTLIEASIVLLVLGIVMVPILKQIDIEFLQRKAQQTDSKFETIGTAIAQYYFVHQFYPCPANPTVPVSAANYGQSIACNPGGYNAGGTVFSSAVSYGAIPFKDLKIDAGTTIDKWGNKIMYAVSTQMASTQATPIAPIQDSDGALSFMVWKSTIVDPTDPFQPFNTELSWALDNKESPPGKGHYILISPGPNHVGAYNPEGTLLEACPNPPNTFEAENCDSDTIFNSYKYGDIIGSAYSHSEVPGPNFYDDLTAENLALHARMWNSASNPKDIFTGLNGRVGVGRVPEKEVALDVSDNIRVNEDPLNPADPRLVKTDSLCDGSGGIAAASVTDCFAPALIAGDEDIMECDPGTPDKRAMGGIAHSAVRCTDTPPYITGGGTFICPAGQYVIQVTPSGVICQLPPP